MERIMFKTVEQWFGGNAQFREYATQMGYDDRRILELGQMATQTDEASCLYENYELMESLSKLYHFFNPWAVAKTDERGEHINVCNPQTQKRPVCRNDKLEITV